LPQLMLGDLLSFPAGDMYFDGGGNLYLSDSNWSRILIYKQPLSLIAPNGPAPTFTPTPTGTSTATSTATSTPTATATASRTRTPTATATATSTATRTPTATSTATVTPTATATATHTPTATATPTPPPTPSATPTPVATCTSGITIERAMLSIRRNLDPTGDEKLRWRGRLQLAAPDLDPPANGVSFAVFAQDGALLFSRTVPPGAATSPRGSGWHTNRTATRWTFTDPLRVLAGGITRVIVRRFPSTGVISVRAQGSVSNYQIPASALPVQVQVVLGQGAQLTAGECAVSAFGPSGAAAPRCRLLRAGDTLICN
jgi:hypothetical protein